MSDIVLVVVSAAAFLAALIAAIGTLINSRGIEEVKNEVTTGNSQTLAQLNDAMETRRIKVIPSKDRTKLERSHLDDMGK